MKTRDMTEGTPWKHILRFAMPVLAGSLLQQLYNTVDTIVVGRFAGEESLAAVGTTASIVFMFMALAIGFSTGNGVLVAQHFGAKDDERVRTNASTGILFLLLVGAIMTVLGLVIARPLYAHLVHVPDVILEKTIVYFRIYALGLIFQFGYNIFSSILRAVGDSAATLYFLLISSVLNIGLDLLFVAGFHWGVAGAAIATDISQAVSFVAAYLYMIKRYPIFRFKLKDYRWEPQLVAKTVKIGFPICLQMMVVSFGLTFIQRAVNDFGPTMTASFTVGTRIEMYLNLPCNSFMTTMATYTGQNVGARKLDRVKAGMRQTMFISLLMTLVISFFVWTFAEVLISFFGLTPEAAALCLSHVRAVAIINLVLSFYIPLFGVFQGTGHSIFPMIVACCALGTRVVVTYLFRYSPFLGQSVIWWNGIFGFGMGCLVSWSVYLSGRWKRGIEWASEED